MHPPDEAAPDYEDVRPRERFEHGAPLDEKSILLDPGRIESLGRSSYSSAMLHELVLDDDGPGSVCRVYRGVQSVLVRRLTSYYRRLVSNDLKQRWLGNPMTPMQFEATLARLDEAESDFARGGRWSERTWSQSLVPERGGVPVQLRIETIGSEIEIFRFGEVALTNEGKIRLGRLSVYIDDDLTYEKQPREPSAAAAHAARSEARPVKAPPAQVEKPQALLTEENRLDVRVALREEDAEIELDRLLQGTLRERIRHLARAEGRRPRGNLLTGHGWTLSAHPSLRLRLPSLNALEQTVTMCGVQVDFMMFLRDAREPWGVVSLKVVGRPAERETAISLDFDFLRW